MTKICSKCGVEKNEGEFYKGNHYKNGLKPICKTCCIKRETDHYFLYKEKNKDNIRYANKRYKKAHTEKVIFNSIRGNYKQYLGFYPSNEIIECKLLIIKTKQLCKTLKN